MSCPTERHQVIARYLEWQTDGFSASQESHERMFLVTPFVRVDGHKIEIEACFLDSGEVRFSDAGNTLDELWMQGLNLNSSTLDEIRRIAGRFRVRLSADDLTLANFGDGGGSQLQDLISAILAISSLIVRRRAPTNTFATEIRKAIRGQGVTYESPFAVAGSSKKHTVDLRIRGINHILVQSMTAASENGARRVCTRYSRVFEDVLDLNASWKCFSLIDDRGDRGEVWTEWALAPLEKVSTVIHWNEGKEEFLHHLVRASEIQVGAS